MTKGIVWIVFSHQPSPPDSAFCVTGSLQLSQGVGLAAHDKDMEELCAWWTDCLWKVDVEHFAICECVDNMHL